MPSYLLVWNPDKYSEVDFGSLAAQVTFGKEVSTRWSVNNSKLPVPGDNFYLIKLGKHGSGIFGSGKITSNTIEDAHYDTEKAKDGSTLRYVQIKFEKLVNGHDRTLIDLDDLEAINTSLGATQKWTPQSSGIAIVENAADALKRLWNERTEQLTNISESDYLTIAGELDKHYETTKRAEQSFLKDKLFGVAKYAECSICEELLPVPFLVCAHIKKRAECSDEEKLHIHVVTPMCRFGCDELFERGYIAVHDGNVVDLSQGILMDKVSKYMKDIVGKPCKAYDHSRKAPYFEWHYEKHSSNSTLNS